MSDGVPDELPDSTVVGRLPLGKRVRRTVGWIARWGGVALMVAVVYVAVGLVPVNRGFKPTPGGVKVYLVSSAVHADLIVPLHVGNINWRDFLPDESFAGGWPAMATHMAVGWGDRGFFLETPMWSDLRPSTTAHALLWPSATCMHVALALPDDNDATLRAVSLSDEQYEQLALFIRQSFDVQANGGTKLIPDTAYSDYDAFFEARGRYHAARNCNNWAGSALRAAGVTVPWYTPLPQTMFLYLP